MYAKYDDYFKVDAEAGFSEDSIMNDKKLNINGRLSIKFLYITPSHMNQFKDLNSYHTFQNKSVFTYMKKSFRYVNPQIKSMYAMASLALRRVISEPLEFPIEVYDTNKIHYQSK